MRAGKSKHELGIRVMVANITDPNDKDLNGLLGTLCHPFPKYPIGDVGITLDPDNFGRVVKLSVKLDEFVPLTRDESWRNTRET